jgi:hypothetical protein
MEDGLQVDSIYTDFSKAFDKVRHQLLLIKLARAVPGAVEGFGCHLCLLKTLVHQLRLATFLCHSY